jgi:TusE/DsrC/DsvC family sulfur relay protein
MPKLEYAGTKVDVDDEGYLLNFDDWDEKVACALADHEGIIDRCPLTTERMNILSFLREYYKKFNAFPVVQYVCRNVRQEKECEYEQFIDPIQAWKIAGLPKPTTEVFAYIKHRL